MKVKIQNISPFITRNAIIAGIGFGILVFIDYIVQGSFFKLFYQHMPVYLFIILGYIVASEGTLYIDKFFTLKFARKQSLPVLSLYKVLATLAFYGILWLVFYLIISPELFARKTIITILISIVYVILIDLIFIISRYKDQLQKEKEKNGRLKEEKLKSDLHALQNQLNPHFLFNSLNVLVSEIYHDADRAVIYIEQLSDIFRYVLESSEKQIVHLKDELAFLKSYIYLYTTKYGAGLQFNLDESLHQTQASIPPLVLQILVENCIKHNKILESTPLSVKIFKQGNSVVVENTLIRKTGTFSTTTGLSNIRRRYAILRKMDIVVEETTEHFRVAVPLLDAEKDLTFETGLK